MAAARVAGGGLEVHHAGGVDRRGDRGDIPVGQDVDIVHAVRVQGRHRAAAGCAEADDGRPERAAVLTGRPGELHRVQHRAVTGHLVVLVEYMQAERAVARPVIHRLKSDQGQPPVNAQLGDFLVLDTVRPAPQDLALAQLAEVGWQRLWEQDDIAVRQELLMGAETSDMARQLLVGHAETLTVAVLEVDAPPQPGIDPLDVQRMDRQPPLVLLPRPRHDAEAELIHPRSLDREILA